MQMSILVINATKSKNKLSEIVEWANLLRKEAETNYCMLLIR
jgi:hypothetical protein